MELRQHSILRISDEKTLELIELYEKEQCLWNTFIPEYRIRHKRQQAAERIARKLDIKHFTSRFVITKFKNLRNSYSQELKRMARSIKNGDRPSYQPKVFWFNKMDSFVRPHLQRMQQIRAKKPRPEPASQPIMESIKQPIVGPARQLILEPAGQPIMETANNSDVEQTVQNEHNMTNAVIVKIEPSDPLEGQASCEEDQTSVPEHDIPPYFPDELLGHGSDGEDSSEPIKNRSQRPSGEPPNRQRNEDFHHSKARVEESPLPGVDTEDLARLMKDISSHLHVLTTQSNSCFDSFGKYVASVLKNMPYRRAMMVQPRIIKLLVESAVIDERRE